MSPFHYVSFAILFNDRGDLELCSHCIVCFVVSNHLIKYLNFCKIFLHVSALLEKIVWSMDMPSSLIFFSDKTDIVTCNSFRCN
mgnify:CR=1 FL=1